MSNHKRKYDYDLEKVERLLKESALSYKEIERQTGCPYATVIYRSKKVKDHRRKRKQAKKNSTQKDSGFIVATKSKEHTYLDSIPESTFIFEKKNVSLIEANQTIKDMLKAAKLLGEKEVNITIDFSRPGTLENINK